jgi:hypothetical protein
VTKLQYTATNTEIDKQDTKKVSCLSLKKKTVSTPSVEYIKPPTQQPRHTMAHGQARGEREKNLPAHSNGEYTTDRNGEKQKKKKEKPVSTLNGEYTQAPYIYAHVIELGANQFWSHPVRRTHQRIPLRSFFCQLDTVAIYICVYVCMYV